MKKEYKSELMAAMAKESVLYPQEQMQQVKVSDHKLTIAVPKEIEMEENRLPLNPQGVALLVNNGIDVNIEAGAGEAGKFSDLEYSQAGAQIIYSPIEIYKDANIILKINQPSLEEIEHFPQSCTLISALQHSLLCQKYIDTLNAKKITAISFELLEDEVGGMPIVRAMSEIAGSTVMLVAAEYLSSHNNGRGIILGGITGVPPTKVVILGAGTVGEYAARTALGLGAEVKIFDNQLYKLRRIKQNLGNHIYTSTFDIHNLTDAIKHADVLVGALRAEDGRSPCIVTQEMVSAMKPNSVIIDVSIDQGGCFETSRTTTHSQPVYRCFDVIHYCVPNIASRVAHTATTALSNIFAPLMLQATDFGGIEELIFAKDWFMKGVYCYKGSLTNKIIGKRLNIRHKDLALFKFYKF